MGRTKGRLAPSWNAEGCRKIVRSLVGGPSSSSRCKINTPLCSNVIVENCGRTDRLVQMPLLRRIRRGITLRSVPREAIYTVSILRNIRERVPTDTGDFPIRNRLRNNQRCVVDSPQFRHISYLRQTGDTLGEPVRVRAL